MAVEINGIAHIQLTVERPGTVRALLGEALPLPVDGDPRQGRGHRLLHRRPHRHPGARRAAREARRTFRSGPTRAAPSVSAGAQPRRCRCRPSLCGRRARGEHRAPSRRGIAVRAGLLLGSLRGSRTASASRSTTCPARATSVRADDSVQAALGPRAASKRVKNKGRRQRASTSTGAPLAKLKTVGVTCSHGCSR